MTNNKFPISACWLLTSRCNYDCQFCFRQLGYRELFYNEAVEVVDKLVDAGITKLTFSGGEPLLWPNLIDIISYAKKKGLITMLISNGSLITSQKLKKLEKILDWITFSLDGSNSLMNDQMTRNPGHFDRIINLLKLLEHSNINIKINTVCSKINADDIVKMVPLIQSYNIKRWKLFQFYSIRANSYQNADKFSISDENFSKIQTQINKLMSNSSVLLSINTIKDLEGTYFTFAPDGTVYLSANGKDVIIGDIRKDSIEKMWQNYYYDHNKHTKNKKWILSFNKVK